MGKTDLVNYALIFLSGEWLRKWGTDGVGRVARKISFANQLCLYSWRRYMQLYLLVSANWTISFPRLRVFVPETEDYFSGSRLSIQTYMCFIFPLIKFGMCTVWREGQTACERTESRPQTHPYFEHLSWFTAADLYIEPPFILCSFFFERVAQETQVIHIYHRTSTFISGFFSRLLLIVPCTPFFFYVGGP